MDRDRKRTLKRGEIASTLDHGVVAGDGGRVVAAWRWPLLVGLATRLLFFWAHFIRTISTQAPFVWSIFANWELEPYAIGISALEIAGALMLLLLFSRTPLFRRVVMGLSTPSDFYQLAAIFVLIQLLFTLYQLGLLRLVEDHITLGLFVDLVAGLLGGWQIGLGIGILAALASGFLDYVRWETDDPWALHVFLEYYVLKNMRAVGAGWAGFAAGLSHEWLSKGRAFAPTPTWLVAVVMEVLVTASLIYSIEDGSYLAARLLPNAIIAGVAAIAVPLVIFATAYDAHAVRAFELAALDYLVKPFSELRLAQSMVRIRQVLQRRAPPPEDQPELHRYLQATQPVSGFTKLWGVSAKTKLPCWLITRVFAGLWPKRRRSTYTQLAESISRCATRSKSWSSGWRPTKLSASTKGIWSICIILSKWFPGSLGPIYCAWMTRRAPRSPFPASMPRILSGLRGLMRNAVLRLEQQIYCVRCSV